jgi:hypothetical protein
MRKNRGGPKSGYKKFLWETTGWPKIMLTQNSFTLKGKLRKSQKSFGEIKEFFCLHFFALFSRENHRNSLGE